VATPQAALQPIIASNASHVAEVGTWQVSQKPVADVAFSPSGRYLVALTADGIVSWWDTAAKRGAFQIPTGSHFDNTHGLAFSADSSRLLISGNKEQIALQYDANTGDPVSFKYTDAIETQNLAGPTAVIFSPDGQFYLVGTPDGAITEVNVATGALSAPFGLHNVALQMLLYSPDGTTLAYVGSDKLIRLWNAQTQVVLATLRGHTDSVTAVAFSHDSKRLASASADKTVRLWDVQTGQSLAILKGSRAKVNSVAFNLDGSVLASGEVDGTLTLWDVKNAKALTIIKHPAGSPGNVGAVAFNPDGTLLALGAADGSVRLLGIAPKLAATPRPTTAASTTGGPTPGTWTGSTGPLTLAFTVSEAGKTLYIYHLSYRGITDFDYISNGPTPIVNGSFDEGEIAATAEQVGDTFTVIFHSFHLKGTFVSSTKAKGTLDEDGKTLLNWTATFTA
jgi:WD40 repeat protein